MIISEKPYCKKIIAKKIDENTFQFVEVFDLSNPECPIFLIDGTVNILDKDCDDNQ